MLTIKVFKNDKMIAETSVVNVSDQHGMTYGKDMQLYQFVDDPKRRIYGHVFDDGVWALVEKIARMLL